jgi:hypothetical protein
MKQDMNVMKGFSIAAFTRCDYSAHDVQKRAGQQYSKQHDDALLLWTFAA